MMRLSIDLQQELRDTVSEHGTFSPLSLIGEAARRMGADTLAETYDEDLSEVIEGRFEHYRPKVAAAIADHPRIDRITAELIAASLCDPAAVLAIAIVLERGAQIVDGATDEIVMNVDPDLASDDQDTATWVNVAHGIDWWADGRLVVQLPDTIMQAAVGRRLAEIVSHPVLDRHPLKIVGTTEWGDGTRLLVTDSDRRPLPAGDLLAIRPDGWQGNGA